MSEWAFGAPVQLYQNIGPDLATSSALLVTSHATNANQVGNWFSLGTASRHVKGMTITLDRGATTQHFLANIAVGTAGNEKTLFANLEHEVSAADGDSHIFTFPCEIPSGTQINANVQCGQANKSITVSTLLHYGTFMPAMLGGRVETYGADTANSRGTAVRTGFTGGTYGTWVQMTASTTRHIRAIVLCTDNNTAGTAPNYRQQVNIGVGSAGNEKVVVADYFIKKNATVDVQWQAVQGPLMVSIPKASRLSIQTRNDTGSTLDDTWFIIYGIS